MSVLVRGDRGNCAPKFQSAGQSPAPPPVHLRPCVRLSPHTAPQPMGCCHTCTCVQAQVSAPQQLNLTIVAAWSVYPWSWRTRLRSSVRSRASVIRLRLRKHPDLPIDRPHVSVSLALPRALASWGILPACSLRLAACSDNSESHRGVTPFRVSICRGFRSVLYAGSHFRVETLYPLTTGPVGDQSRLGLPLSR